MNYNVDGYLPEGIHTLTWDEFKEQFGFSPRRKVLMQGLFAVIQILKECGCDAIYIDGSFVTDKLEPDDWDACFKGSMEAIYKLDNRDTDLVLDDIRKRDRQKEKYFGELYPPYIIAEKEMCYLDFFQCIKGSRNKKGIIKIMLL